MDNSRLIQLCSEGDKEAISILYRRYGPSMARVIQRYVGHSPAAKDILHDGFLVILGRISEVRQPQTLEYWMVFPKAYSRFRPKRSGTRSLQ